MKIRRGPTDILEALAATVSRDYTAAHYKFEDDPYLIPVSNSAKRSYALSKESGRKAARWIRDSYPRYIIEGDAVPKIPPFSPKESYTDKSEVSLETLQGCIAAVDVTNSIAVYENLKPKGIEIDTATRQQLLELLCFYNCENAPDVEFIEENWFRGVSFKNVRKAWRGSGLVDQLFNEMQPKTSHAYAAMIRGLSKHLQSERAWLLFKEMQENRLPIDVETYNAILRQACYLRETSESRWQLSESLLAEMRQAGLRPNLGTLNVLLENFSRMGMWKNAKKLALQVLAELHRLGIEPSLGSYYFLLLIFCRERGPVSTILYDIIDQLRGKELSIRNPKDVFFFVTAMDVCHTHLRDKELAFELDALLHTGKNRILIGDSLKEAIYHQHFFKLLCETATVETFFEYYNKLVPHVYTPEPTVMLTIIHAVEDSGSLQYIPQLWTDLVSFEQHSRENLIETMLNVMANGDPQLEQLRFQFADIALHITQLTDVPRPVRLARSAPSVQWTGQMLGNVMLLLLRGDKYDNACDVMDKCRKEQHRISGLLTIESLELFVKTSIEKENASKAVICTQYMADAGYLQAVNYAQEIMSKLDISELQRSKLSDIVSTRMEEKLDET